MANLFYGDMVPPLREPAEAPAHLELDEETVLVGTAKPVDLTVERIPHHLAPEGTVCVASYLHGRLIGRCAIPAETAEEFLDLDLFRRPVALALNVRRRPPVVEGNLLALVPASEVGEEEGPEEAWRRSVPGVGYDAAAGDEGGAGGSQLVGLFLGQVVRFEEDRRFPESLVREAADMLAGVVRGRIGNVIDRVIEDLDGPTLA